MTSYTQCYWMLRTLIHSKPVNTSVCSTFAIALDMTFIFFLEALKYTWHPQLLTLNFLKGENKNQIHFWT